MALDGPAAGERHVVVLGLMGAGKSSIGRRVAKRLGRELVDGDEELQRRTGGRTAADIVGSDGLEALHRMEAEVLLDALRSTKPAVIAPAASTVEDARCRAALDDVTLVWLTASAAHLAVDVADKAHRPLVSGGDAEAVLARQIEVREPLIRPLADLVVDVEATSKGEAADLIAELVLAGDPSRSR